MNGAEVSRYSQVGVATPDHTIRTKNWPVVAGARKAASSTPGAGAVRVAGARFCCGLSGLFLAQQCALHGGKKRRSILTRAWCWCRASACSGSARRPRTRRSPPTSPRTRSTSSRRRNRISAVSSRSLRKTMFDVEYWSLEQAKLGKAAGEAAGPPGGRPSPAAAPASARRPRKRSRARGCGGRHSRPRSRWRRKGIPRGDRRPRTGTGVRRDQTGVRGSAPSMRWWPRLAASTSWCRTRARPGRGASARRGCRPLRQSFEFNFFVHQTVAQTP